METADLVVLPAFVEHKPRRLLQAAANKIPVIASVNCGLEKVRAVITVEAGNAENLRAAVGQVMATKNNSAAVYN